MRIDAEELLSILSQGEGRQLEFKRGLPGPEKTARSICAFANTRGGMLMVGIDDRGSVYGIERPREVMDKLRKISQEVLSPPVEVQVAHVEAQGKHVVVCSVPHSAKRPHSVLRANQDPEIVVRVGSSNRRASGPTLDALKHGKRSKKGLDELERSVLAWIGGARRGSRPEGNLTIKAFAKNHNVGLQRARRAFTRLERDGHLVGHGFGPNRVFSLG